VITIAGMTPVAYIALAGAIGRVDATELRTAAAELVGAGVTDLTIDLSRETFLGSVGLQSLTAVSQLFDSVAGRMVLTGPRCAETEPGLAVENRRLP
jgi:anti-anti-sigma regulatory factor